jgi:7-cyano-7-deazaguanine synthase
MTHDHAPARRDAIVLLSGGIDSAVLACDLQSQGFTVHGLAFDYGQRHAVELHHAVAVADRLRAGLTVLRLPAGLFSGGQSSQVDGVAVPEGHHESESMRATIVPGRNLALLALAAARAEALGYGFVGYAAHRGDHAVYPDCRPQFAEHARAAIAASTDGRVDLVAPYLLMDKAEVVARGARVGAPLAETWSCYAGGMVHCGRCGACTERRGAFVAAGVGDPTAYLPPRTTTQ